MLWISLGAFVALAALILYLMTQDDIYERDGE